VECPAEWIRSFGIAMQLGGLPSFELGYKSGPSNKNKTLVPLLKMEIRSFELHFKFEHIGKMRSWVF